MSELQQLILEKERILTMSEKEACSTYNVDFKSEILKMIDEETALYDDIIEIDHLAIQADFDKYNASFNW